MATEPITIFSHAGDPAGVLDALRALSPSVKVVGPPANWSKVTVLVKQGLFRRRPQAVTFTHDRAYYAGPDWPRQRDGMAGYVSRFPATARTAEVMRLIASLRFSVGVLFEPDERADRPDERLEFVAAVAAQLDGVWFRPSGLYDAAGRVLYHASGNADADAVFPALPAVVEPPPADEEPTPTPPTAERVARRAMALAAVGARGLLEQEDRSDGTVEQTRGRLLEWVAEIGVGDELEPDEWKVLQTAVGKLLPRDALYAGWRLEGLGVLAWALNRFPLPPHDVLCDPGQLLPSVGLLNADRARAILSEPPLRPAAELTAFGARQFAVHWRLREFRLRPKPIDFRAVAAKASFGPLDLTGTRLVDDDLALGDDAIAVAPKERVQLASSAAQERHLAANWLHGDAAVYSQTDTPT